MGSNVVDDPILNSPFEEPARHYDFSGPIPRVLDGRRRASYLGIARTERMGDAALAAHEFVELTLANHIRERVRAWRERRWDGVTETTRTLLEHWSRPRDRPLLFCQREAVETLIWLTEARPADLQGIDIPSDEPNDLEAGRKSYKALKRYCTKMATGSGKTTVMAMLAAWSILNKVARKQDGRFTDNVLVVCPNLTIRERLQVLIPQKAGSYYETFDIVPRSHRDLLMRGRVFVTNWHAFAVKDDAKKRGIVQRGRESDAAFVRRVLGRDLGQSGELLVLNDEAHHAYRPSPQPIEDDISDAEDFKGLDAEERKELERFAEQATIWVGGLDRMHKVRGVKLVVDLSATPYYLKGSGHPEGTPFPWIVSDFGLVDAIESGITKIPRIPVADDSGRPDPRYFKLWHNIMESLPASARGGAKQKAKPEAVAAAAQGALSILAGKWKETYQYFQASGFPVPPAMIVVAANTALASEMASQLRKGDILADFVGDANTFAIDSKVLAEAEAADDASKDDQQQALRLKTSTIGKATWPDDRPPAGFEHMVEPPGKNVRAVVSVGMLTEGWDANNVTQILGLRAFSSQLLCEQVVGRGLRRMSYEVGPDGRLEPEYCDVFGIPFEVIPVKGTGLKPVQPQAPSTLVQSIDERSKLEIEFPRVEGFIQNVKQRIRCDLAKLQPLMIEPFLEPTSVITLDQMGLPLGKTGLNMGTTAPVTLTRDQFYAEHRLQRTAFEIARDITEVLTGGKVASAKKPQADRHVAGARTLFPQVLELVQKFLDEKVSVTGSAKKEEVALARYRSIVIERLLTGIEPDTDAGEDALLPRLERHRPVGSTAEVFFRTSRPTQATRKSHVSHTVLDSGWESTAAFHLEQEPAVISYVKNEAGATGRLNFEIQYSLDGHPQRYVPDFLVVIAIDDKRTKNLILEVKGLETEQERAKWAAAQRWCRAVTNQGQFGTWEFLVSKTPTGAADVLKSWLQTQRAAA